MTWATRRPFAEKTITTRSSARSRSVLISIAKRLGVFRPRMPARHVLNVEIV
jgi:hypothetical protein